MFRREDVMTHIHVVTNIIISSAVGKYISLRGSVAGEEKNADVDDRIRPDVFIMIDRS